MSLANDDDFALNFLFIPLFPPKKLELKTIRNHCGDLRYLGSFTDSGGQSKIIKNIYCVYCKPGTVLNASNALSHYSSQ